MLKFKEVIEKLENSGISIHPYKENGRLCGYELGTFTDAGVNQLIFIDFRDTEMNPKNAKNFIEKFNERVNDIDIEEDLKMLIQDKSYMHTIGIELGISDLKEWKQKLQNIFNSPLNTKTK